MKRIIVGISGASGVVYGIRLLEILRRLPEVEVHLVLSTAGKRTIAPRRWGRSSTTPSTEYRTSSMSSSRMISCPGGRARPGGRD
jgi:3-polyprenyl-4-hydroxybenzoate decarboxylase